VILQIEFRADAERWRVRVVETGYTRDGPNQMGFNARGQVASIGGHPDIGTKAVRVVSIYDAQTFDPARTAFIVWYFTKLAHQDLRRGLAHLLDLFDRFDLIFELPGYSEIAADLRRKFEHDLYAMTSVRSYSINGRKRRLPLTVLRWR